MWYNRYLEALSLKRKCSPLRKGRYPRSGRYRPFIFMKSNLLVIDGGTVKTEEDGLVTGMAIVFGSPNEPDSSSQRDFFTADTHVRKNTEFTIPLYYNHAMGPIREEIGEATVIKTDSGWRTSAKLDLSTESGKKVYEYVKDKPHGFSTGAVSHLVIRESQKNDTNFLKQWPIGELSLTQRPAERRALVQSVKSVDGELVYEPAFEESKKQETMIVTFYDADGNSVWDSEETAKKELASLNPAKIEFKYVGGSASFHIVHGDEDSGVTTELSMSEFGNMEEILQKMSNIVNKARSAKKSEDEPEFEDKVKEIIKAFLAESADVPEVKEENSEEAVEESEPSSDEVVELEETKKQLADAQERIAQLEILADATKTINKHKGK